MNTRALTLIAILVLTSLACSFTVNLPTVTTGPTETLTVNEAAPKDSETFEMTINMGAGDLTLAPGAEGLISGEIRYNVSSWKPTIQRDDDSIEIAQEPNKSLGIPGQDLVNEWNLKLGKTPLDLSLHAGAYKGTVDLSGVPLTNLKVNDGASQAKLVFKEANPAEMEELSYKTGASQVELSGLGYANASEINFDCGAGNYTLDFSGPLQRDVEVSIKGGVSNVKIIVPKDTLAVVDLTGGLKNVSLTGTWNVEDHVYTSLGKGYKIEIEVDMGLGNLELISR